ncbi:MAG: zinc-ribbon domain-containing protein [Methylococcales bacterium]|nr:zinc-ribbon domain-containing protein [Methylococcales bacterium]
MIIVCDECSTRFKLNTRLINKTFFKVRCSKCQHVFSVETLESEEVYELDQISPVPPMKVITICSHKGGVAKTSTCLNLGVALSMLNKRVLLIDFDVQANLSLLLGQRNEYSFYEIIQEKVQIVKAIKNVRKNVWLLPSNSRMALLAKQCLQQKDFGFFLRKALEPIKENFDYILIDTPPSVKFFTPNALMAADFVIIPTQCEFLAMNGVLQTENIIKAVSKTHPLDYKVLITMYDDHNTASKVIYAKLKQKYHQQIFKTLINYDSKMQESQIVNQPIAYYDKNARSAQQYHHLANEIELL